MIEKSLIRIVDKEQFKYYKRIIEFLKKHGELIKSKKVQKVFKGDTDSNIIAHICLIYMSVYQYKNIVFTIVENSLDDSVNIVYEKLEG